MSPQEIKTTEAAPQQSTPKKEGLTPFGVNKYDIQHMNEMSAEYEKTQDNRVMERLTQAKLDAAKNAVSNELESYLNGYGNPAIKVDRVGLENSYKTLKSTDPSALSQTDNMGYILLSFLENYETLSRRIAMARTTEQKPHREIAIFEAKDLKSAIKVDMRSITASLLKGSSADVVGSQQISEADSRALDDARKNAALTASNESKDELEKVIAKVTQTELAKETKSKPKLTIEQKAKITHQHVTQELIDSVYEPRAHELLKAIHETKSPAESEKLVAELQKLIKIKKDDGAFGKNSLTALHTFNQSSKEYGSEMTKIAQDAVKNMPVEALQNNFIQISNALAVPNQPADAINRLSYLLAHINTKAQVNKIVLPYNVADRGMQAVTIVGKRQSSKDATIPDTTIAQSKEKEIKLTKFENFVKNGKEGATFTTSDSPNITFKIENNQYLYSIKNGFAPVTPQAIYTAFQGKESAKMLAEAILKNKNNSQTT